jgi:hypothetical protein
MLEDVKTLLRHGEEYIETNVELTRLKAIHSATDTASYVVSMLVIIMSVMLFVFMLFIGFSFLIGHALGRTEFGFFIMAGVIGLFCIFLYAFKDKIIKNRVCDLLVKKILN